MHYPVSLWVAFFGFVLGLLALDLGVFQRRQHKIGLKESLVWSGIWVILSLAVNLGIYYYLGFEQAAQFLTCYVIEKSLSIDNLFVFLAIFNFFHVRGEYQHRVLFWGIIGAFAVRGVFIAGGTVLLSYLSWLIYLFAAFLVYKGFALWRSSGEEEKNYEDIWLIRLFKRFFPVTANDHGPRFFVREADAAGRLCLVATPLLIVLLVVDVVDIVFAVDSIPAIIGITSDTFVLITSNVMAVLGLRALYFVLAAVNDMFRFLQKGMCLVLVFVGAKMMLHGLYVIPTVWSLGVIAALIGGSIGLSLLFPEHKA